MSGVVSLLFTLRDEVEATIIVGDGVLGELPREASERGYTSTFIVYDSGLPSSVVDSVRATLSASGVLGEYRLPAGESAKRLETIVDLWESMLSSSVDRSTLLVAVGGGAVLDSAGFAAATYMRGIPWATVPTTLLAMADAAMGGKTAVNFAGKNIVGAFHHPVLVVSDVSLLDTLPVDELRSGAAEIVKHGVIDGRPMVEWLRSHAEAVLRRDRGALTRAVAESARVKMSVVARDYREVAGLRAVLNLGHTVGHAIEKATGYNVRHGYAVSMGLMVELEFAHERFGFPSEELELVKSTLEAFGLPVTPPCELQAREVLVHAKLDKKRRGEGILMPIARRLGDVRVEVLPLSEVLSGLEAAWARLCVSQPSHPPRTTSAG